jgi:hypothetical protein
MRCGDNGRNLFGEIVHVTVTFSVKRNLLLVSHMPSLKRAYLTVIEVLTTAEQAELQTRSKTGRE